MKKIRIDISVFEPPVSGSTRNTWFGGEPKVQRILIYRLHLLIKDKTLINSQIMSTHDLPKRLNMEIKITKQFPIFKGHFESFELLFKDKGFPSREQGVRATIRDHLRKPLMD